MTTKTRATTVKKTASTKFESVALAEVDRLNDQEFRLALAIMRKSEELAGVKAKRGDAVLDAADQDGAAREAGRQVTALREEIESLADAARRARERRIATLPKVYIEKADAKERQAAELEAEATRLEDESRVLLEAVQVHADWGFLPAIGRIDGHYFAQVPPSSEYRVIDGRGPRWTRMRQAAASLRSEAGPLRFTVPHAAGSVGGSSVEDLIAAVHAEATRLGPSASEILAWVGSRNTNVPMRLHLQWTAGVIDTGQSHIYQTKEEGASEVTANAAPMDTGKAIDKILEQVEA